MYELLLFQLKAHCLCTAEKLSLSQNRKSAQKGVKRLNDLIVLAIEF
jgi:hypothetical protein